MTKIRSKWVNGLLEFFGITSGATVLKITESGIEGNLIGNVAGALLGSKSISKAADYSLTAAEKANTAFLLKATAASKTFTLGLAAGQIAFIVNVGTNAFTVKNVAADTGTEVAATKAVMIIASATANASTVIALN